MAKLSSDFWTSPIGGNWAYWSTAVRQIAEFIKVNRLTPSVIGPIAAKTKAKKGKFIDLGIRGGIRAAHLHFDNKIFLLDEEQWGKFSDRVIADSKAMLQNVKKVGFEQTMALANAVQGMK